MKRSPIKENGRWTFFTLLITAVLTLAAASIAGTGRVRPPVTPPPLTPEQTAAVQTMIDKALAAYDAKHKPTTAPVVVTPPAPQIPVAQVITPAQIRGVWYQPVRPPGGASFADWKALGINTLIGYERQSDINKQPTVSMAEWDQAAKAAGLLRIREPGDLIADAKDVGLIGFQQPDELDAAIITAGPNAEPIYLAAEQLYKLCKAAAPGKPVYMNFDGEQVRWHLADGQVDYPRLLKCCDCVTVDWHPVQRGEQLALYGDLLDRFAAAAGGKLVMMLVETSNEELDARYYHSRTPTPDEVKTEAAYGISRRLGVFYFTQRMTEQGHGFLYDNTPAENRVVIKALNQN